MDKYNHIDNDEILWNNLISKVSEGDLSTITESHLASGQPVYSGDEKFPGKAVKKYPDGRCEVVYFDDEGNEIIETML